MPSDPDGPQGERSLGQRPQADRYADDMHGLLPSLKFFHRAIQAQCVSTANDSQMANEQS